MCIQKNSLILIKILVEITRILVYKMIDIYYFYRLIIHIMLVQIIFYRRLFLIIMFLYLVFILALLLKTIYPEPKCSIYLFELSGTNILLYLRIFISDFSKLVSDMNGNMALSAYTQYVYENNS